MKEDEDYDFVQVNMAKREHRQGGKHESPNQKLPFIKLSPRGEILGESVSICRFIEESAYGKTKEADGKVLFYVII